MKTYIFQTLQLNSTSELNSLLSGPSPFFRDLHLISDLQKVIVKLCRIALQINPYFLFVILAYFYDTLTGLHLNIIVVFPKHVSSYLNYYLYVTYTYILGVFYIGASVGVHQNQFQRYRYRGKRDKVISN